MRCDYIAEGVIKATKELDLKVPLVVRLQGTKEHEAKQSVAFDSSVSLLKLNAGCFQTYQGVRFENLSIRRVG